MQYLYNFSRSHEMEYKLFDIIWKGMWHGVRFFFNNSRTISSCRFLSRILRRNKIYTYSATDHRISPIWVCHAFQLAGIKFILKIPGKCCLVENYEYNLFQVWIGLLGAVVILTLTLWMFGGKKGKSLFHCYTFVLGVLLTQCE